MNGILTRNYIGAYPSKTDALFKIGNGLSNNERSDAFSIDFEGETKIAGHLFLEGHDSPIGDMRSAEWIATTQSSSGAQLSNSIYLQPGIWQLTLTMPTMSASSQGVYIGNLSSVLGYGYFTLSSQQAVSIPVEIDESMCTGGAIEGSREIWIASGSSTSNTFSNISRGRILAVRIA